MVTHGNLHNALINQNNSAPHLSADLEKCFFSLDNFNKPFKDSIKLLFIAFVTVFMENTPFLPE